MQQHLPVRHIRVNSKDGVFHTADCQLARALPFLVQGHMQVTSLYLVPKVIFHLAKPAC